MICRACSSDNRVGRKFCAECGARLEIQCTSCGAANAPGEKFCGECGVSLAAVDPPARAASPAAATSERRLVTILFADLVDFTSVSEHRDPEDVRELLTRYFDRCRALIERYGGTVEKFIGDAVMAVWGTPVAREDDAERAVRAALGLTNAVAVLGQEMGLAQLRVRAGVLTGRASVELGVEGEGMVVGDTVNTASRLQALAEPGTVLVDEVTRRASEAAIAYEDAGIHTVKGRDQPIHAWSALRVVAGAGGARRAVGVEPQFVGREKELQTIISASEESAVLRQARMVTILGDAGSGKSRLLWEFFKYIDGITDERWWHEGRCLSYGDGVAFWALAEMIRDRAGIVEEEAPAEARRKLHATVCEHVADERERRLVEPRLAHLLGLEQRTATEAADLFSGWRLFFERMAQAGPVILAFEDLQWADSGLLDFIGYLLEWSAEHPIFILAVGRTEVRPRRSDWGTEVTLSPLADEPMSQLLSSVARGLPTELAHRILQSAEGVPLYAVETVRMLRDRGVLVPDGERYAVSDPTIDLEVPETLQALIAARLDDLDATERALLQDAAVLGMSFPAAGLAAVSGHSPETVAAVLESLVARQVLGREPDPRGPEHGQYRFLQAMVRTIALSSLSRKGLKRRHLAAAHFLLESTGEVAEIAEVLASHYLDAVEVDPDAPDADEIRRRARQTLAAAGHRAVSLALGSEACRYFERAAELSDDPSERAALLGEAGVAAARAADRVRARSLLHKAISGLDTGNRASEAALTRCRLAEVLIADNRLHEAAILLEEARRSVTDEAVVAELAARHAQVAFLTGDSARALAEAETALDIAEPRGLDAIVAEAAMTKGSALFYRQRFREAQSVMTLSLDVAIEGDLTEAALRAHFNVSEAQTVMGSSEEGLRRVREGVALARERGNRSWERNLLAQCVGIQAYRGAWDEALQIGVELGGPGGDQSARLAAVFSPVILAARGLTTELEAYLDTVPESSEWHELAVHESVGRAIALCAVGRDPDARGSLRDAAAEFMSAGALTTAFNLGDVIDALLGMQETEALAALLDYRAHPLHLLSSGELQRGRGRVALQRGDFAAATADLERAVRTLRGAGNPFALGRALHHAGECMLAQGQGSDGAAALQEARRIFAELRADAWITRVERSLAPADTTAHVA